MAAQSSGGAGTPPPGTERGAGGTSERMKATAAEAQERATGTAREAADQARDYARETAEEAKHQVSRLTDEAQRRARSLIDRQKESAADAVGGWAHALRQAARQLDEQEQPTAGRYAEWAADGVDRFSRSLREQELDALVDQAERFARRQPALFLGGAVALGFMASRFFKSSAERRRADYERRYGGGPDYGSDDARRYGGTTYGSERRGYGSSPGGYAPSTGYDPTTGTYGPGSAPGRDRYPSSAASHAAGQRDREVPPPVGGL